MRDNSNIVTLIKHNDLLGRVRLEAIVEKQGDHLAVIPIGLSEKLWGLIPRENRLAIKQEFIAKAIEEGKIQQ